MNIWNNYTTLNRETILRRCRTASSGGIFSSNYKEPGISGHGTMLVDQRTTCRKQNSRLTKETVGQSGRRTTDDTVIQCLTSRTYSLVMQMSEKWLQLAKGERLWGGRPVDEWTTCRICVRKMVAHIRECIGREVAFTVVAPIVCGASVCWTYLGETVVIGLDWFTNGAIYWKQTDGWLVRSDEALALAARWGLPI